MKHYFTLDDFELGRSLGRGKFGQVWLAREKSKGYIVALKILTINEVTNCETIRQVRREIEIHSKLKHPNILRMYGFFYDMKKIYLVLEYAGKGEIFKLLYTQRKFSEKIAAEYLLQLIKALKYMHKNSIIHRDIKPENILLGSDDQIKLADFGWAVKNKDKNRKTFCGTAEYLAPEMASLMCAKNEVQIHDYQIDLWCLGILAYEFVTGKTPFETPNRNMNAAYRKIKSLTYEMPDTVSELAKDFIRRLLVIKPEDRMSLNEALNHNFIIRHCGHGENI